tara:strand:- start:485 stop:901 length:417 start_codon:yes stop_codon:yes gene_type:complete
MSKKFYHSEGCNSATIEIGGRTVLYSVKPSEVKVHTDSELRVRNPNYVGRFGKEPEFMLPRTTVPKQVIVAGYVAEGYARTKKTVQVTEVEPITDESERQELTDLLGKKEFPDQLFSDVINETLFGKKRNRLGIYFLN